VAKDHSSQRMAPPESTEPKIMNEAIAVTRDQPEEEKEKEANYFAPRNTIPRTPPKQVAKPTLPLAPGITTPPTKYCMPGDTSRAPKKKDTKLTINPEALSTLRHDNESSTKSAIEPRETPTDQARTETGLEPTMEDILAVMEKVHNTLLQKVIRSEQKTEARSNMEWIIAQVKAMSKEIKDTPAQQEMQQSSEENISLGQVMAELAEIKKAVKQTYSQAVQKTVTKYVPATTHEGETHHACATGHKCGASHVHATQQELQPNKEQEQDKARSEQAKKDVILTTRGANDEAQKKVENTEEEAVKESLQKLIQQNEGTATVEIKSVRKLAKHVVRIRCHTESDATKLRQLRWEEMLSGVTIVKMEYGIVIHGVPKNLMENIEEFMANIERANQIKVKRIALLTKNARNPDAPTQSIVIFTETPEEANKCIDDNAAIERRLYHAERYIPQCQIKQCFRCQTYGHKADICKRKPKCGRCAQEHETRNCTSEELKCANCKDAHVAWNHECPRRQEIAQNMETRKSKIPSRFPC